MILRSGVIAAGLVVAAVVLVAGGRAAPSRGGVSHTCSATDRQFISVAELNISAIGMFGEDYLHGNAQAKEVLGATRDASLAMADTNPRDGSLSSDARTRPMTTSFHRRGTRVLCGRSQDCPCGETSSRSMSARKVDVSAASRNRSSTA